MQEGYPHGVSTRKVDDLVQALGLSGISQSQVSELCRELDERVQAFLTRPLTGEWLYVWLDATDIKVREAGRIVAKAVILAPGVDREDAHEGLKQAIAQVLGATWQRCRVHILRNCLAYVPKGQHDMVAAAIRSVFAQPDHATARAHWRQVTESLRARCPKLAALRQAAEEDMLAFMHFPAAHRTKLHSTNPLERLNKEVKRRTDVIGIFPNEASVVRLVGALLLEQNDEWAIARRCMTLETLAEVGTPAPEPSRPALHGQAA